jgi:glycosyltransferase involved in cell wall biosynthesis
VSKVYVLPAREDWIVDRFVREWFEDNSDITVSRPEDADVIWLLASWCWQSLSPAFLGNKKVLTTVHHIVPNKFDEQRAHNFMLRDLVTTAYHVYNEETLEFVRKLTKKPIHLVPYWANQKIWHSTGTKEELRKKYGLPTDGYLVGSFQRDTEGHNLSSPKLEKGPDLLVDYLEKINKSVDNLHVVLAGWRRQYVIARLQKARISYTYFEKPPHTVVNDLYQTLDLYPVTSRHEGGPQSLIECGLLNIPVVSRDIGVAKQTLPLEAIASDVSLASARIPDVESWKLPVGYEPYRKLIQGL